MRTIALRALRDFWQQHSDAEQPLRAWYHNVKLATWRTPADVKNAYRNASLIGNNRVVFNVKGNDYRLVAVVHYQQVIVYIRFVGTREQYDRVDATTV
jgi:mRNA interferase HigB